MKNFIKSAAAAAIITTLTSCTHGPVQDKQAPGYPGEKTYMVMVDGKWIETTDHGWLSCKIHETYPACLDD